jgi:hypothetical protein
MTGGRNNMTTSFKVESEKNQGRLFDSCLVEADNGLNHHWLKPNRNAFKDNGGFRKIEGHAVILPQTTTPSWEMLHNHTFFTAKMAARNDKRDILREPIMIKRGY